MRVLVDANVVVAAFATRGLCSDLFALLLDGHIIVSSERVLGEIESALRRKVHVPKSLVAEVVELVRREAEIGVPVRVPAGACRDRKDLHVLGLAKSTLVDVLVSGDRDLLELGSYEGVPIESPRELWERLRRRR